MIQESSSNRIKNLITELIFKDSYWGHLFSKINRSEDKNLPAPMGVTPEIDGTISLIYNSNYIDEMDNDFLSIVIEHEGIHILNNHIPRLLRIISNEVNQSIKNNKIEKWNIAADCAVNTIIPIKKIYHIGKNEFKIIHPDLYNLPTKQTAEYYNEYIPDDPTNTQNSNGQQPSSETSNDKNQNSFNNGSSNKIDDHQSWIKNISKVSDVGSLASRLEQYTDSIVEESYNNVRKKGNLPGYIKERINEILKPPQLPYYQMIAKLVKGSRLSKQKRAYTRINKKRVYTFFIDDKNLPSISPFPGKTKDFSFNISIILDTSGSMKKDDVLEGLSGVKNIIENDKYCRTTILEIDTIIQKEYEVKKLKDIDYTINGRGGTRLLPALVRCKELNTDVTLVFTDGECDNINNVNRKLLPRKIIYILTKDGIRNRIDQTGFIMRLPI
jgi:predicted metal-dependent peptidase